MKEHNHHHEEDHHVCYTVGIMFIGVLAALCVIALI